MGREAALFGPAKVLTMFQSVGQALPACCLVWWVACCLQRPQGRGRHECSGRWRRQWRQRAVVRQQHLGWPSRRLQHPAATNLKRCDALQVLR